jgi:hypothetical protein
VERREASAPCAGCALCRKVQQGDPGFSAFCFLLFFPSVRPFVRAPFLIVMIRLSTAGLI